MKYLLYTDVHWCENSSSIQSRGNKFSTRLEYLIKSVNWAEQQAIENTCDAIICLGDFFDRSDIKPEEATALQKIDWVNLPHYFIVGNHEASNKSLEFNSVEILRKLPNFNIITKPTAFGDNMLFLPYIKENEITSLKEYWDEVFDKPTDKRIIFSHNSVKGIQMGPVISKEGIEMEEIDSFCTMFINGHLHNGLKFSKKGINLGNLTGQNFGEDATRYSHNAFILDTDTNSLESIENPYAFNFYKFDVNNDSDLNRLKNLKNNAVVSVKCNEKFVNETREILESQNVVASRILTTRDIIYSDMNKIEELVDMQTSHLVKFIKFVKETLDNTEVLNQELEEICKNVE